MSNITAQNRIKYQIDTISNTQALSGLSMLQHFDYPENINYLNGACIVNEGMKFGKGCAYFPNENSSITISNTTGMFNLSPLGDYELECFVKANNDGNILRLLSYEDYQFFNGHTFKYFSTPLTWSEAKSACEAMEGHLATSTSEEKNTFLSSITSDFAWLGATDELEEGTWLWVTGEEWSYTSWPEGSPDNANNNEHYLEINRFGAGSWNDRTATAMEGYICEWDYDIRETINNPMMGLALTINNKKLSLISGTWCIKKSSQTTLNTANWCHLLLRISNGIAYVFADGVEMLRAWISGSDTITPSLVILGGFVGCMDEFAFRCNAGSDAPPVPTAPYDTTVTSSEAPAPTQTVSNNAPVSRVAWSCENLPEGLSLSASGLLSGHPTTAGTYDCDFTVSTNWGTDTKTIRIVIE